MADEMGVAGLMEISNGSTRNRVGNNTKMLGIVDGRFNNFDSGIYGMGSIYSVKKVTFMGGNQDNIGEAHIAERFIEQEVKDPTATMMGLL